MIRFEDVGKRFGPLAALEGVSLTVRKGEAFGLLGPNGAGKTTLVRLLLGFSRCTSGRISIAGLPAGRPVSRSRLGYLAEVHCIPPYLSGREYLLRHAGLCGLSGTPARQAVAQILERVGMQGEEKRKASQYSKGMVQRIGLAAALMGDPELLVLDEPGSGLDPLGMRDVRLLLEDFRKKGGTILLNSHMLSEVERICDSIAILHRGRIAAMGALSRIVQGNETLEELFIRLVEGRNSQHE